MYSRFPRSLTALVFTAILFAGSGNVTLAQSGDTRHRIEALLGTRDTAVTAEQWRASGDDARAILEAIASDPNSLPTKRARAVEGIVALRTVHANELLVRFAHAEKEPEVLRMAAVRGLGHVYLRRDPNSGPDTDYSGYDFWLTKLNAFNGNFVSAEMVKAFISSSEYRQRFGP